MPLQTSTDAPQESARLRSATVVRLGSSLSYTGEFTIGQLCLTYQPKPLQWGILQRMAWDWKAHLARDLKAEGIDMKSLSLAAGLGETAVRDLLMRWPDPRLSTVLAVAKARGMSLSELVEGEAAPVQKVPIV